MKLLPAVTRSLACVLAFSAFGCSDPPPRPASLGFTVNLRNPDVETGGRFCPVTSVTYEIGDPGPTGRTPGKRLEDGTAGASVTCTIKGKGDGPYQISAEGGGRSRSGVSLGKQLNILALGGSVTRNAPGNVLNAFGLFTPDTQGMALGQLNEFTKSCAVTTIYEVGSGLIHADFSCPALVGTGNTEACSADGTFVFEYCQVE